MKFPHVLFAFGIMLCLFSCSKDANVPYKPTEWQYDKYSNQGILPGDDFYRFVCGKGIASEGSDSWAPFAQWGKQQSDYEVKALSDGADNPVPVFKRINELRTEAPKHVEDAFARMRERLDDIENRTENKGFPEKAAEYCRDGYFSLFQVAPMILYGHKFGILTIAVYKGVLQDWSEQELKTAGIKEKYNNLLPKARMFEKYLLNNIKNEGVSIDNLDAGDSEECRQLKAYVESFAKTKAGDSAFERFAVALGNQNPDFVPVDDATRQYFELVDKMDAEMKEAANAFLWCAAVSYDMDFILHADTPNSNLTILYPNLLINMSRYFCEEYVNPECAKWSKEIFEALRSTMAERLEQSEWMTPYTKAAAKKKIDAMECHTGILDWSRYEADMPVSGDFCSAVHEIGHSHISKMMANSGENTSLDHIIATTYIMLGGTAAYTANAFYVQTVNAMCILPSTSILMDMNQEFPFLTYIIGHEMCHGFDANGSGFNERGELGDWWSIDDKLVFKNKQNQLIGIFNQYYVDGITFCNGAKTIAEDMADLGGMEIAYYTTARELESKFGGEELLEMKRRFFKSYAILYAKYTGLEEKLELVEKDDHSLNEYRINGIVNNIDDWYPLFDVTPERKFYLAPERRVYLW